ncbi:hypothetical protein KIL84_012104 [Mauremys mutica]|uniref:Uncharacterized protein n=1 Tax=Mauremys mutica TaxID=74926 RepID=A0A9D3XED9_9SAUR|nr:hypothetical protein KIL84_012104 [Mauremys mutica]
MPDRAKKIPPPPRLVIHYPSPSLALAPSRLCSARLAAPPCIYIARGTDRRGSRCRGPGKGGGKRRAGEGKCVQRRGEEGVRSAALWPITAASSLHGTPLWPMARTLHSVNAVGSRAGETAEPKGAEGGGEREKFLARKNCGNANGIHSPE